MFLEVLTKKFYYITLHSIYTYIYVWYACFKIGWRGIAPKRNCTHLKKKQTLNLFVWIKPAPSDHESKSKKVNAIPCEWNTKWTFIKKLTQKYKDSYSTNFTEKLFHKQTDKIKKIKTVCPITIMSAAIYQICLNTKHFFNNNTSYILGFNRLDTIYRRRRIL